MLLLWLAAGGVAGTLARYGIGRWVPTWAGDGFPWATFASNVVGSFLLGALMRGFQHSAAPPELRAMLTVGFCGAFTTFSTFTYEAVALMQDGAWARASVYAFGSLALGLAAMYAGLHGAALVFRAGG